MNDSVERTALDVIVDARDARNARLAGVSRRALKRARHVLERVNARRPRGHAGLAARLKP